jgi:hypothetical protein
LSLDAETILSSIEMALRYMKDRDVACWPFASFSGAYQSGRFQAKADISRQAVPVGSVENDQTKFLHKFHVGVFTQPRPRLCENPIDAMIPLLNRGGMMKGFVQGADRQQTTLLPECLDDWVDESNPVHKTIADFRKDNGPAIKKVCAQFVALCRKMGLLAKASVAIDGSKFKAVNTRDRNFTQAKMQRRLAQINESIARYLSQLDSADRQGEAVPEAKITRLNEKIATLRQEILRLNALNVQMMQTEDKQISLTDPDARSMATSGRGSGMVGYNVQSAVDTKHHLIVAHEVTAWMRATQ